MTAGKRRPAKAREKQEQMGMKRMPCTPYLAVEILRSDDAPNYFALVIQMLLSARECLGKMDEVLSLVFPWVQALIRFWSWLFLLTTDVPTINPLVDVTYAKYHGIALPNGITRWLGMRYAAAPLGELRFAAPQDPEPSEGIQIADKYGKICLATGEGPNMTGTSEDCLFLNVFAPSNSTQDSLLPVFFFIQGGGFNCNSNPSLDGSGLIIASGMKIVVVEINYRVGPYGFIAGSEIASPNNGLKDQRKALKWVQNYISLFGGNPNHVVIGGDSAGAASIALQLTAFGGRNDNLFHGTAAESLSFATVLTAKESEYQYDNLVKRVGCIDSTDTLACLRNKTAEELQAVNYNIPYPGAQAPPLYMWNPVIDDEFVTDLTYSAFGNGKFVRVPVIFGDTTNGGTIFTPKSTCSFAESNRFLQNQFPYLTPDHLTQINGNYPRVGPTYPRAGPFWRQLSNAYGEMRYLCPGLFCSSSYANRSIPSWNYRYNVEDPRQVEEGYGVPHVVELNAIWGPENVGGGAPASYYSSNAHVVPILQGYWTSFIRSLNPNTFRLEGTPVWEIWTSDRMERLLFNTSGPVMETVDLGQQERCAYLNGIGVEVRQ